MVSALVQALGYHCLDCRRSMLYALLIDNPSHWSKPDKAGPTYCPCCGAFHSVADGQLLERQVCPIDDVEVH